MPGSRTRVTRRNFLQVAGGVLVGTGLDLPASSETGDQRPSGASNQAEPTAIHGAELSSVSARRLAEAIRRGELSSEAVTRSYLARIEAVNPWLNAVVTQTAETALRQAREADRARARREKTGPLHGVPMTIKDSLDTAGAVSAWGVPAREHYIPREDATVVRRLKAAGAILLGKTNTPELTYSFETNSPVHGPTNNPYDLERTSGGSSGGAAAIVASGGSPFDIGSDTGGSIRVPAHCCGVAGIRPTSGRVPRTGNAVPPGGLLDPLTQIGPIARYVEDLWLVLPIIAGPDGRDPSIVPLPLGDPTRVILKGLRGTLHIGNGIRSATVETEAAVRAAAEALADKGVVFEERRPPGIEETFDIFTGLFSWDDGAYRRRLLERAVAPTGVSLPPTDAPRMVSPVALTRLLERWDLLRHRMLDFLSDYDVLVCPVNAYPALAHGAARKNLNAFSYTMTYSLTGWPAVVLRGGVSPEGLPIGVQIIAQPWREDVALAAAKAVEEALGGWQPPSL